MNQNTIMGQNRRRWTGTEDNRSDQKRLDQKRRDITKTEEAGTEKKRMDQSRRV